MPPNTAASARQTEIVEATIRVIARDGLAGASLRAIAREIGYSTGVLMHHFRDKEELLVAAADAAIQPVENLLADAMSSDDASEGLRRICVIPLPTTAAKRTVPRVYAQVLASAESEPAFAKIFVKRYGAIPDGIRTQLTNGQRSGALRSDFDPAIQCDLLCALVDGLALRAVSDPSRYPAARLIDLVTQELEKLRP